MKRRRQHKEVSEEGRERPDMGKESRAFKMMTAEQRVSD